MRTRVWIVAAVVATGLGVAPVARAEDQCLACHRDLDKARLSQPAERFTDDAHHRPGLGCAACHGGDPTAEDPEVAMDPKRGFRGTPKRAEIPKLCGSCHANAAFIRKFNPNLPTDQWSQYKTSVHGRRVAEGDTNAAVCMSCHGVHPVRRVQDPRAPVYPTRVVDTCASCHGNAKLMARYGLNADQPAKYKRSVHYEALTKGDDLSAPTCNDCHGSHGATPPQVASVANVCGVCHVQNFEMVQNSPHGLVFPDLGVGVCEACHGNHEIRRPSNTLVGVGEGSVCGTCHDIADPGGQTAQAIRSALETAQTGLDEARAAVERASRAGMLMEPAEVALQDARQDLVRARVRVHLAVVPQVQKLTGETAKKAAEANKLAEEAFQEIRYRRHGLLISLGIILVAIVALVLKIRNLES